MVTSQTSYFLRSFIIKKHAFQLPIPQYHIIQLRINNDYALLIIK